MHISNATKCQMQQNADFILDSIADVDAGENVDMENYDTSKSIKSKSKFSIKFGQVFENVNLKIENDLSLNSNENSLFSLLL